MSVDQKKASEWLEDQEILLREKKSAIDWMGYDGERSDVNHSPMVKNSKILRLLEAYSFQKCRLYDDTLRKLEKINQDATLCS